jgi:phosphoribosylformylglycinamidine synthase
VLRLPIAHAEGRFHADEATLARLESDHAVGLRYCDERGGIGAAANPNGSLSAIAGIYGGPRRNVFGLMPHPERMSQPLHGCEDGRLLFEAAVRSVAAAAGATRASHP